MMDQTQCLKVFPGVPNAVLHLLQSDDVVGLIRSTRNTGGLSRLFDDHSNIGILSVGNRLLDRVGNEEPKKKKQLMSITSFWV